MGAETEESGTTKFSSEVISVNNVPTLIPMQEQPQCRLIERGPINFLSFSLLKAATWFLQIVFMMVNHAGPATNICSFSRPTDCHEQGREIVIKQ